jgi:subtilisin family serine protease
VAFLDTGCWRDHPWFGPGVLPPEPRLGIVAAETDPELIGDVAGPLDGFLDGAAGHGTFVAGLVLQACPDVVLLPIRVADSMGTVLEGDFIDAVQAFLEELETGLKVDVLNISLGYYHETPDDGQFDVTLSELLARIRELGCAVVCSAGNDSTSRPAFPAALWDWPDAEFVLEQPDPKTAAPHVSVGALNPNGSVALFSNVGRWVDVYARGVSVVSTSPMFRGGMQPGSRLDRDGVRRESLDPDDFATGFAVWSGTSFAAPLVAGRLAAVIGSALMDGTAPDDPASRAAALAEAYDRVRGELEATILPG